jgi:hypothetical protein
VLLRTWYCKQYASFYHTPIPGHFLLHLFPHWPMAPSCYQETPPYLWTGPYKALVTPAAKYLTLSQTILPTDKCKVLSGLSWSWRGVNLNQILQ